MICLQEDDFGTGLSGCYRGNPLIEDITWDLVKVTSWLIYSRWPSNSGDHKANVANT